MIMLFFRKGGGVASEYKVRGLEAEALNPPQGLAKRLWQDLAEGKHRRHLGSPVAILHVRGTLVWGLGFRV